MSKPFLCIGIFVWLGVGSVTEGIFWGRVANNFGAFGRWKHRVLFGNGNSNRRQDSGTIRPDQVNQGETK